MVALMVADHCLAHFRQGHAAVVLVIDCTTRLVAHPRAMSAKRLFLQSFDSYAPLKLQDVEPTRKDFSTMGAQAACAGHMQSC